MSMKSSVAWLLLASLTVLVQTQRLTTTTPDPPDPDGPEDPEEPDDAEDLRRRRDICFLDEDPGRGDERLRRWYFSHDSRQCEEFTYRGKDGNENRFRSQESCIRRCVCGRPKRRGPCNRHVERFYYDRRRERCRRFIYGGCGGNGNNFRSRRECQRACDSRDD